jgi:hypothetical protein
LGSHITLTAAFSEAARDHARDAVEAAKHTQNHHLLAQCGGSWPERGRGRNQDRVIAGIAGDRRDRVIGPPTSEPERPFGTAPAVDDRRRIQFKLSPPGIGFLRSRAMTAIARDHPILWQATLPAPPVVPGERPSSRPDRNIHRPATGTSARGWDTWRANGSAASRHRRAQRNRSREWPASP